MHASVAERYRRRRSKPLRSRISFPSLSVLDGYPPVRTSTEHIAIVLTAGSDMGGPTATVKPDDSAAALLKLVKSVTKEHTGKFLQRDGSNIGY